jgi:hypothetical protein
VAKWPVRAYECTRCDVRGFGARCWLCRCTRYFKTTTYQTLHNGARLEDFDEDFITAWHAIEPLVPMDPVGVSS